MYENRFSVWSRWEARGEIKDLSHPGVHVVAYTPRNISGQPFSWLKQIIYVGMTNAVSGLKGRLLQFQNTISGKRTAHGGADRVRYEYPNYSKLAHKLYVAVCPFRCDAKSEKAKDLRVMGKVAEFEYLCLAEYVKTFSELPQFNNKQDSPKYSRRFHARERK